MSFAGIFDICHSVSTVADALRAVKNIKPEIIVFDVSLPDGRGFDILRVFSKSTMPVLMCISGLPAADLIQDVASYPLCKFLPKPFSVQDLTDALRLALEDALQNRQGEMLAAFGSETQVRRLEEELTELRLRFTQASQNTTESAPDNGEEPQPDEATIEVSTGKLSLPVAVSDIFLVEAKVVDGEKLKHIRS